VARSFEYAPGREWACFNPSGVVESYELVGLSRAIIIWSIPAVHGAVARNAAYAAVVVDIDLVHVRDAVVER
jgi:hypothetical protein